MKELFFAPIAVAIILGMAADLEALGNDAAERTTKYADDAVNALDCAYEARPLTECSPDLLNPDFSEEIERTHELLEEIEEHQSRRN